MVYVYTVLCVALCSIASTQAGYDHSYLLDNCNGDPDQWVIYLGWNRASTYGVVQLMRYGVYGTNYNCSLKLVSPAGYSINIVVDKIGIYAETPYTCSPDYLEISNDVVKEQYCGRDSDDRVMTMDNHAVVRFVSGAIPQQDYSYFGFSLYYNLFHDHNCTSNEHKCERDNRCILRELTCDTRNNCGDYTDEYKCTMAGWTIFLCVLGALLVVGIIVIIVVVCCCKSKKPTVPNVYPQVYAVSTTTSSEKPITEVPHLHQSPPPPYHEATATTIVDTKYNDKQQYDV